MTSTKSLLEKLQDRLGAAKLDGLWVSDPASIEDLVGLRVECGERLMALFVSPDQKPQLLINRMFYQEPQEGLTIVYYYDFEDVKAMMANLTKGKVVGLDKWLPAQYVLYLIDHCKASDFVVGSNLVDSLRAIKGPDALAKMEAASKVNDQVMEMVKKVLRPGVREIEIAHFVLEAYQKLGAQGPSFSPLVLFGDHGADPHGEPGQRQLTAEESIIVDIGCVKDGYCSDMTRTYFLGANPFEKAYQAVLKANQAAILAIQSEARFCDIDKVARDIIGQAGYRTEFLHRLGHGIGKEVHEPYDVSGSTTSLIEPGMCFSIEPGIYVRNQFGIRIEDLVMVGPDGRAKLLNHVDKENPVLPL